MFKTVNADSWTKANLQLFWGEIAPRDHVVQIYDNNKVFMDSLEGFVGSGILAGESIIVIATAPHLEALLERLKNQELNMDHLIGSDQYIAVDVDDALSKFLINDWPDEKLFLSFVCGLMERAQQSNRRVRAFGEMVATLWEKGFSGATVQLEYLWNQLHHKENFSLFCAYPRIGFTQDAVDSIQAICACHTKIIHGGAEPSTEIYYKSIVV